MDLPDTSHTSPQAPAEPAASLRKAPGLTVFDDLRFEVLLRRYMPEDARGCTLGACDEFGCFILAGAP